MLSVLIPFYDGHQYIDQLLKGIPETIQVIIVDDQSEIPLQNIERPNTRVVRMPRKGYFSGAVNHGLSFIRPKNDVLILNQDSSVEWAVVEETIAKHKEDVVGERVKGKNPAWPNGYIHGTFMLIRASARAVVPYFDETNFPLWGATADYQLRVCRAGLTAKPLQVVPGYTHFRHGRKGSSIKALFPDGTETNRFFEVPPVISVVVNMYNQGRYISDLLASLFGGFVKGIGQLKPQTFQAFEVIIVNDGSTDNSLTLAKEFETGWNGVRVLTKENGGSASAMNHGIAHAKGRYIAPLDSDDMMTHDRLETLLKAAEAFGGQRVICDDIVIFKEGKKPFNELGEPNEKMVMADHTLTQLLEKNRMHKGIFFTKDAWEKVGGYPNAMNRGREDWAFNIALESNGYCGHIVHKPMYIYRRGNHNRTLTNTKPVARAEFAEQIRGLFPTLYLGETTMACCGGGGIKSTINNKTGNASLGKQTMNMNQSLILLKYMGTSSAVTWTAPSGTQYVFGVGKHSQKYVKPADVQHFTSLWENSTRLFQEVVPEVVPEESLSQTLPTQNVGNNVGNDVGKAVVEEAEEAEVTIVVPDLTALSVNALSIELASNEFTKEQLQVMRDLEANSKNRVSALALFDKFLEQ